MAESVSLVPPCSTCCSPWKPVPACICDLQEGEVEQEDLVDSIAADHELTVRFARELVDSVFDLISQAARNGEEVSIFGFGKFKIAERAARKGWNPATGEAVKIAASKNLRFTPARSLEASLNKRRARKSRA